MDVGGVGYEVQIPLSTFYELAADTGATVSLRVHTHVREDALLLFGFSTEDERTVFEQLISISGVGPRLALAILSGIGVCELREAIYRRDRARLQKIPGVGKKTAERVLLELRDKMKLKDTDPAEGADTDRSARPAPAGPLVTDAVSALVNLGYSAGVAERAVQAALEDEAADSLEALLKSALSGLVR